MVEKGLGRFMEDRLPHQQFRLAGLRGSAVLEIVLFFGVMLVIDMMQAHGQRFWGVEPHPYWFIILLVAAQYGTAEGLLAVIVAICFLLIGNMPQQQLDQDMYAYLFAVTKLPLLWAVSAVTLGELRNRHIRERAHLYHELELAREREEKITESYEWVREHKQKLELRIAGQFRTAIDTYRAARAIEKLEPKEVLQGVQEIVRAILNPEKFSVFLLDNEGLQATIMHGWSSEDNYLRSFDSASRIYKEVMGNKAVLCTANDEQARILAGEGVLAGPLINMDTGDIIGMLKIEHMAFVDLHMSTIEAFKSISEWIAMAFVNAGKYQEAKSSSLLNPEHNLLTSSYFKRHTDYVAALAKRLNFNVSMIVVTVADAQKMDEATRSKAARRLSKAADAVLRSIDLAFDYQHHSSEYSIVLPATDVKGARIVQEKIEKELRASAGRDTQEVKYTFSVQSLHEKLG